MCLSGEVEGGRCEGLCSVGLVSLRPEVVVAAPAAVAGSVASQAVDEAVVVSSISSISGVGSHRFRRRRHGVLTIHGACMRGRPAGLAVPNIILESDRKVRPFPAPAFAASPLLSCHAIMWGWLSYLMFQAGGG